MLGLLTGPQALALAAGVGLAWLSVAVRDRRLRNPWLVYALAGTAAAVPATVAQSLVAAPPHLLLDRGLETLPETVRWVLHSTLPELAADRPLTVVLLLAVLAVVLPARSEVAALALGAGGVTLVLALLAVSSAGVRDHLAAYPVVLLAALSLLAGPPGTGTPTARPVEPRLRHPPTASGAGPDPASSAHRHPRAVEPVTGAARAPNRVRGPWSAAHRPRRRRRRPLPAGRLRRRAPGPVDRRRP